MVRRALPLLVDVLVAVAQVSESMKKFDGMMPPTLVFADEGKNGEPGPPPSPSMDAGADDGLTMRSFGFGLALT